MEPDGRRRASHIAASVLVAILACFGLLLGGNIVIGSSPAASGLSSSGRDSQQTQLTARDVVRGLLVADRKIAPKQSAHDAGPATPAVAPALDFTAWSAATPLPAFEVPLRAVAAKAHQPRAPPQAA